MDPTPVRLWNPDYSRRRAEALTKHLSAIAETRAELLRLFDSWLAPSVGWKTIPLGTSPRFD